MRARYSHQTILCRGKWHVIRVEKRAIERAAAPAPNYIFAESAKKGGRLGPIADEVAYLLRNQPLRMPGALWRPDA